MKTATSVLDLYTGSPVLRPPEPAPLKLLAAIDLTAAPATSIEHAINVASTFDAELTLLYVAGSGSRELAWPAEAFNRILPGGVRQFTLPGYVPATITAFAESIDAGLVLLTSNTSPKWTPFWKRSVTDRILAATRLPVLVSPPASTGSRFRARRILCALTLDGTDHATLSHAEALARRSESELILLGTVPAASEALLHEVLAGGVISPHRAFERLHKIGRHLSVPYHPVVFTGSLGECLAEAAREHAADLVVTSRETFDARALLRRLTCPLLSVSPAGRTVAAVVEDARPPSFLPASSRAMMRANP